MKVPNKGSLSLSLSRYFFNSALFFSRFFPVGACNRRRLRARWATNSAATSAMHRASTGEAGTSKGERTVEETQSFVDFSFEPQLESLLSIAAGKEAGTSTWLWNFPSSASSWRRCLSMVWRTRALGVCLFALCFRESSVRPPRMSVRRS